MNNPKVRWLFLLCAISALGAVLAAFAAGSHFQIGYNGNDFNFDFRVGTQESKAAIVLGLVALGFGLATVWLFFLPSGPTGDGGKAVPAEPVSGFADFAAFLRHLTKSKTDVWVAGVCGGLGEHTPLPSWVWRLGFLLLLCCYGTGVVLYVLLAICVPEPPKEQEKPATSS